MERSDPALIAETVRPASAVIEEIVEAVQQLLDEKEPVSLSIIAGWLSDLAEELQTALTLESDEERKAPRRSGEEDFPRSPSAANEALLPSDPPIDEARGIAGQSARNDGAS